jgi:hypothetical protein
MRQVLSHASLRAKTLKRVKKTGQCESKERDFKEHRKEERL